MQIAVDDKHKLIVAGAVVNKGKRHRPTRRDGRGGQAALGVAERSAAAMMRRRKALAEHPFGTLKCRPGYRHFLVRGFAQVRSNGA